MYSADMRRMRERRRTTAMRACSLVCNDRCRVGETSDRRSRSKPQ